MMRRSVAITFDFNRRTSYEHPDYQERLDLYISFLTSMKLPKDEIEKRLEDITSFEGPLSRIEPEVERLLGPAKPVADVLLKLDRQYKEERKPAIYFLEPHEPIAPHLDSLIGKSRINLPPDQPIAMHLNKLLGPAASTKDVFAELDLQYREQNKPRIWFLPLSQPIAPHLNELLGPVRKGAKE